jgi:HSP20 family protein
MLNKIFEGDVKRTLDHLRQTVDELFHRYSPIDEAKTAAGREDGDYAFAPALESAWSDSAFYLRAILPGVSEKDVNVSVRSNQLILEGERNMPEYWPRNAFTRLSYGKFYSAITLPDGLNLGKIKCRIRDGVLDVEVPISEHIEPRPIQVESGEWVSAIPA